MGYGFKEILDLSPLSIKSLNDQLYMLWRKIMGGISEGDILEGESEKIVEKGLGSINIGVGAVAGTNLVRNGRGNHGTEAFSAIEPGSLLSLKDDVINKNTFVVLGEFVQLDIPLTPGETYCVGCNIDTNEEDVTLAVYCQLTNSSSTARDTVALSEDLNTDGFSKNDFTFTAPTGIKSCLISFDGDSEYKVTDILLKEGEAFSEWTPHEGEVYSSGISISQDSVSISSANVEFNILDPENPDPDDPLISMSASSGGFNRIVTKSIEMRGVAPIRVCDEDLIIYVNPAHVDASDANSGESSDFPLFTINGALKKVGMVTNKSTTICLASGTTYREDIKIFGYQGKITFDIYGGTTNPIIYSTGVLIECCTMVEFLNINFYCFFTGVDDELGDYCEYYAISYRYSKGYLKNTILYIDTFAQGTGIEILKSNVVIKDYEIYNFYWGFITKPLASLFSKEGVGYIEKGFATIANLSYRQGKRPDTRLSGFYNYYSGSITGATTNGPKAVPTGIASPYEYLYYPTFSGSWTEDEIVTSSPSNIKQGEDMDGNIYTGVFGFNLTQMRSDLAGKTIKNVYLRLSRLSDFNAIRDIHLWGCDKIDISGDCPVKDDDYDYGVICTFNGEETLEVGISPSIVESILDDTAGTPNSLMIFDDWFSPVTILGYDQLDNIKPLLRVCV
jgi:hypothetical protein